MADGKIKKIDLLEPGAEKVYETLRTEAVAAIEAITQSLNKLAQKQKALGLSTKDLVNIEKQQRIELKNLQIESKKAANANQNLLAIEKQKIAAIKRETAELRKQNIAQKNSNQSTRKAASSAKEAALSTVTPLIATPFAVGLG